MASLWRSASYSIEVLSVSLSDESLASWAVSCTCFSYSYSLSFLSFSLRLAAWICKAFFISSFNYAFSFLSASFSFVTFPESLPADSFVSLVFFSLSSSYMLAFWSRSF